MAQTDAASPKWRQANRTAKKSTRPIWLISDTPVGVFPGGAVLFHEPFESVMKVDPVWGRSN